jgi:hypothetical protein
MRMDAWDSAGRRPLFGHQVDWITEILEAFGASDVAVFATGSRDDDAATYYVATPVGLLIAELTPDPQGQPTLATTLTPWKRVDGLELLTSTVLDDGLRRRTTFRLRAAVPVVALEDEGLDSPLVELWRECALRIGHPPTIAPKDPG